MKHPPSIPPQGIPKAFGTTPLSRGEIPSPLVGEGEGEGGIFGAEK